MRIIEKYFPNLNPEQAQRFGVLEAIYQKWNARINVISRQDMEAFYEHHVLHSLAMAKIIVFNPGTDVLDLGTGGGFPGIPLAILWPQVKFHLVDSVGKKIKVVEAVIDELGLRNATAERVRAEKLERRFDFILARAIGPVSETIEWINGKIKSDSKCAFPNGFFFFKGGDLEDELKPFADTARVFHLCKFFEEEFFEAKKVVYLPG